MAIDNKKEVRKCYECRGNIKQFMASHGEEITHKQFKCDSCYKYFRKIESTLTGKEVWFSAGKYNMIEYKIEDY